MVSKSFLQPFQIGTILTSAILASATASLSATVPSDAAIFSPLTNSFPHTAPTQLASTQLAQIAVIYPTLRAGSVGESVSRLQATLKLLGFYQGSVDGTYGPSTQQAVISFQSATDLTADGIAGPATWGKLLPALDDIEDDRETANTETADSTADASDTSSTAPAEPGPTATDEGIATSLPILRPGSEGSAVSQLQKELQTLDYYNSSIDGNYGDLTEAAVREFQADQQLLVDGVVGPSTWEALSKALEN